MNATLTEASIEVPQTAEAIRIRGARMHNLKNIDLDIPREQLVVITGPSGSGKSSLAFDTLYAEGQRQYIESLSPYARQFLHQMERPDVDLIEGLQPTICIDQRPGNHNPRSTVATVTEVYDYLRLLMARLGQAFCYKCGEEIRQQTPEQIRERLLDLPDQTKMFILAPLVRGRRGQHKDVFQKIRKAGFLRARVNGDVFDLEHLPDLPARRLHHIEAVVDRVIIREGIENRITESIQTALRYGEGLMITCYLDSAAADDEHPHGIWMDALFSTHYACPRCNISYEEIEPRTFSFNSPYGACHACDGLGRKIEFDLELVIPDPTLTLEEGAVLPWKNLKAAAKKKLVQGIGPFLAARKLDWDTPLSDLKPALLERFLRGDKKFLGVLTLLEQEYVTARPTRLEQLEKFRAQVPCQECGGSRLRPEANSVRVGGKTIHEICQLPIRDAHPFFQKLSSPTELEAVAKPLKAEICSRLEFLDKVGVSYLTLDRPADTLSGGELQRVRLATSIGSGLVGVCYVLDEPSIGLHPRDNQRLIDALRDLQQQGNTVVVVEHDEAMMRQADRLIDVGPEAGQEGGRIVAEGSPQQVAENADSVTAAYLRGEKWIPRPPQRRKTAKSRSLFLEGVTTNNLKNVDVQFPLGTLICVTGVSGSGKSSLVNETLARALKRRMGLLAQRPGPYCSLRGVAQIDKVVEINQSPIGRTPRSNPATYTGAFDDIRKVFAETRDAKQRGFRSSRFSFNVKGGRCEVCQGQGVTKIEMNFLPDLYVTCSECQGARFNDQTLQVKYRGKSIADVLGMAIDEAVDFFENFAHIHRVLKSLQDVGLGYLQLGQPSTTLSGGEAQRIKLATPLAKSETGKFLYLLDEPTTGLHFDDIRKLLDVLSRLVDRGNTVVVIEHHLDVIQSADWILDLGPEGGEGGGHLVACGTPEEIAQVEVSPTGQFLRQLLDKQP